MTDLGATTLRVLVQNRPAALLTEAANRREYVLAYLAEYLASGGPFITPWLTKPEQNFFGIPPAFLNLLPESYLNPELSLLSDFAKLGRLARNSPGAISFDSAQTTAPHPDPEASPHKLTDHPPLNNCLATLAPLNPAGYYAPRASKQFFGRDNYVWPYPSWHSVQILEARQSRGYSLSGVQLKFSWDELQGIRHRTYEFIIKPGPENRSWEFPANEHLSMNLAAHLGLDTAECSLAYSTDSTFMYFTKRFDRFDGQRYFFLDAAQVLDLPPSQKAGLALEEVIAAIADRFQSDRFNGPILRMYIINYLLGNFDLHLKNFGFLSRDGLTYQLAPAYDVLNLALYDSNHRMALSVNGKYGALSRSDFYAAANTLSLDSAIVDSYLQQLRPRIQTAPALIERGHLSPSYQQRYKGIVADRTLALGL